ncbi:MAG: hypothetical protein C0501_16035 [Isosphaera sp.]|nr:hypothetical protein [Isosphaera sp.]
MLASEIRPRPVFPDSDGNPVADNTLQFEWLSTIKWNLEHLFESDPAVFVAGDNLIYPDETDPGVRQAPDVYVAFGRPKGYRGSYKVWEEGGVFPQVVFEVWSPGNTMAEMDGKREFYEKYGAEEFYLVFPEFPVWVAAWWREGGRLVRTKETNGFTSPRLGIHIRFESRLLTITGPDGRVFRNPLQIAQDRDAAERLAADEARRRQAERDRAEAEKLRAEAEAARAESRRREAEAERDRAEAEKQRADRLAARLRELGLDPDAV